MNTGFNTSNGAPYQIHPSFPQSYDGDQTHPALEQPSLHLDGTINPSLLTGQAHGFYLQQNQSSISPYASGDVNYQHAPPVPPISTEVWMGYDGASMSEGSPTSPMVDAKAVAYVMYMESCECGCDNGACIPQRQYDRPRTDPLSPEELQETIWFSVNGVCGYPLKDALRKQYTGLEGRDDKMFANSKSSISIRLEWLPYEKWTRQIRTLTWRKEQDHITRAKLATEVAKRMDAFFKEMGAKEADPSYRQYCVQPGIIDLDNMELVALKRVSKSSWMPHLRQIPPPPPQPL